MVLETTPPPPTKNTFTVTLVDGTERELSYPNIKWHPARDAIAEGLNLDPTFVTGELNKIRKRQDPNIQILTLWDLKESGRLDELDNPGKNLGKLYVDLENLEKVSREIALMPHRPPRKIKSAAPDELFKNTNREAYERQKAEKAKLISEAKELLPLRLTINILSAITKGKINELSKLVNIHLGNALPPGITVPNVFGEDISQDQLKNEFIKAIDSGIRECWNLTTKNIDQDKKTSEKRKLLQRTLVEQSILSLTSLGYNKSKVVLKLCKYFDIPEPKQYTLSSLRRWNS